MKNKYGHKVYKLSLDLGLTCPNRDGTKGFGGCSFCSEGGSGDFAEMINDRHSLDTAIEKAKARVADKTPDDTLYVAYFQSFTNTYGDEKKLLEIFTAAAARDDIVELAIGTRPDSISQYMLEGLSEINKSTPVTLELGLQTINDNTARSFNRGYDLSEFEDIYPKLKSAGLTVAIHLILGLPGENLDDMRDSVKYIASLNPEPDGIKLALLHILKNTKLGKEFEAGDVIYSESGMHYFTLEEYSDFIAELLQYLPDNMIVHRLTGDPPKKLLIEPKWTTDKKNVLNTINRKIK